MISTKSSLLKTPFIYIRIPKCGSRSICYALNSFKNKYIYLNFIKHGSVESRHLEIKEINEYLLSVDDSIDNYWRFSIVRNPYLRLLSQYFSSKSKISFKHWVFMCYAKRSLRREKFSSTHPVFKTQTSYLRIGSEIKMDKIYVYENGFSAIAEDLSEKLGTKIEIPYIGKCNYDKNNYQQYYSPSVLKVINSFFEKDFRNFGYEKIY